jgi:phenylalanyl-tRNA synthetase alpha subunit
MSENPEPQPNLTDQFRELGENIKNFFQSAWESEESQKFRQELQNGLNELGKATNEAVDEFKASEAGQKFKAEAEDFKARVESGEVEAKARHEISKVLTLINTELGKLNQKVAAQPTEPIETEGDTEI